MNNHTGQVTGRFSGSSSLIRRLVEQDRCEAIRLLAQQPIYNLYLLSNIEQLGFDTDYCEFWGDVSINDSSTLAILNRYMTGWSIYGCPAADWPGMAQILDNHPMTANRLQDNPGGIESFLPYLTAYTVSLEAQEQLMQLEGDDFAPCRGPQGYIIRRADMADLARLVNLYADADSMSRSRAAVERPLRNLRVWIAEKGGRILASALTNAEIEGAAMIGGVYTEPEFRGRGLGRSVCSALCAELLAERKRPALYWKAPAAGSIYTQLGFHSIGYWRSVWLSRK